MSEGLLNTLYLIGYGVAFTGLAYQTYHIYKYKYVRGLTLMYIIALVVAKACAIPRAVLSTYWVWWVQEGIATALTVTFAVGVILYGDLLSRRNKNKKGEKGGL